MRRGRTVKRLALGEVRILSLRQQAGLETAKDTLEVARVGVEEEGFGHAGLGGRRVGGRGSGGSERRGGECLRKREASALLFVEEVRTAVVVPVFSHCSPHRCLCCPPPTIPAARSALRLARIARRTHRWTSVHLLISLAVSLGSNESD
jgi:hypothetical protein